MSYATPADLAARIPAEELVQLTDRSVPPSGLVDEAVLGGALAYADALIDSLVGNRYAVPLAPVPPLVVDMACDLARHRLYVHAPPEEVRARFEDARRWLHDVNAARADIPGAAPKSATSGSGLVQFPPTPRAFGRDQL